MADPADPLSSDADSQTTGLYINLAVGLPITLLCLVLFDPLRRRIPSIFEARRQLHHARDRLDYFGNRVFTPPAPSYRLFGWLLPTLRLDLETIADTHGLDAALFLRYHRFMLALFTSLCVPALLLLPMYYTAENKSLHADDPARTLGVNKFSLSNVSRSDPWRFWLLLAVEYGIAIFVCFHIIFHFALYCRDRRRYRAAPHPANYAVLVQDIPAPDCSEDAVRQYWQRVFPDQIAAIFFVHDARRLEKDKDRFWKAVDKRETAELRMHEAAKKRSRKKLSSSHDRSPGPRRSDASLSAQSVGKKPRWAIPRIKRPPRDAAAAVEYWEEQQRRHWAKVSAHQIKRDEGQFPTTQSAIVVFKSRRSASIAAQTNFARKEDEWRVSRIPEPNAINWGALGVSGWTVYARQAATALLCVGFILFWIIPVTAIMGLVNLSQLAQIEINGNKPFRFLENIRDLSPVATGFVESWLPTVILTIFLAFVPNVLEFFVSLSRIVSHANKDSIVRDWYFMFITFSNFLFVAFAGTLLDELAVIIDRPSSTVEILARNIPKQAAFMMNFIILTALTETPRELLQLIRVGVRWGKLKFLAKTKRQRDEADVGDMSMDYVGFYAMSQLIALLGLVYCTIQPFIVFSCMAYFGVSYVVFKYNLCFSLHNEYEDGGRMFGGAIYSVWLGLFVHLLTMIGVFGLNSSAAQSALIIIPSVLAVLFVLHCNKSFDRVIEHGSALETQDRVEQLEGRPGGQDEIDPELIDSFEHPGFEALPEPGELENLSGVENEATAKAKKLEETGFGSELLTTTRNSYDKIRDGRLTNDTEASLPEVMEDSANRDMNNGEEFEGGSNTSNEREAGDFGSGSGSTSRGNGAGGDNYSENVSAAPATVRWNARGNHAGDGDLEAGIRSVGAFDLGSDDVVRDTATGGGVSVTFANTGTVDLADVQADTLRRVRDERRGS